MPKCPYPHGVWDLLRHTQLEYEVVLPCQRVALIQSDIFSLWSLSSLIVLQIVSFHPGIRWENGGTTLGRILSDLAHMLGHVSISHDILMSHWGHKFNFTQRRGSLELTSERKVAVSMVMSLGCCLGPELCIVGIPACPLTRSVTNYGESFGDRCGYQIGF